jgi:hypothetical protein
MANVQLFLALGVPLAANGLLFLMLNSRMSAVENRMTSLEVTMTTRFDLIMSKLTDLDTSLTRLEA